MPCHLLRESHFLFLEVLDKFLFLVREVGLRSKRRMFVGNDDYDTDGGTVSCINESSCNSARFTKFIQVLFAHLRSGSVQIGLILRERERERTEDR